MPGGNGSIPAAHGVGLPRPLPQPATQRSSTEQERRIVPKFARGGAGVTRGIGQIRYAPPVYKHILAGTDFSDLGDKALHRAAELAVDLGARLTLVHVVGQEDAQNAMYGAHEARQVVEKLEAAHEKARGELAEKKKAAHVEVACEVRVGAPADQILALASEKSADLIVVASNGQKGLSRWLLGSVADRVVRGADRDVLVVT